MIKLTSLKVKKAIKFLEKQKVSLVVTDIQMPKMNGFEFLKLVRQNEDFID
ncbi:MAG: response regulator, partial [Candidatus Sericytochromatia bacterium]